MLITLYTIFYLLLANYSIAQDVSFFLENKQILKKKELLFIDFVYESKFRAVQLYPNSFRTEAQLNPPIVSLSKANSLVLEFDELGDDAGYYEAKIIHCNQDWQPSVFRPIEYLTQYNEFNLQDFEFSVNTMVNYTHFRWVLPPLRVSGNYLLVVFREGDEDDIIITRRFVVYEDVSQIGVRVVRSNGKEKSEEYQRIEVNVAYQNQLLFPRRSVKAVIRQNQRWDNAIYNLAPLFVRDNDQMLDFNYMDGRTDIEAGNEFRFFNTAAGFGGGFQVKGIVQNPEAWEAYLYPDQPWDRVYNQQRQDHNGTYFINSQAGNPAIEGDYFIHEFTLETGNPYPENVHVLGSFNRWQTSQFNQMQYVPELGAYKLRLLLKQGIYDYRYVLASGNQIKFNAVDGSDFRAENEYDVILYYRNPGEKADRVIGYQRFTTR